jgi:hypothetical protein
MLRIAWAPKVLLDLALAMIAETTVSVEVTE